jgi:hypothetical protein
MSLCDRAMNASQDGDGDEQKLMMMIRMIRMSGEVIRL